MTTVFARLAVLCTLCVTCTALAWPLVLPGEMREVERKRFERFQSFQIRGVCGDSDLASLEGTGVNTVRGYTISTPKVMIEKLDDARRRGLMMVVSEWMPHHGKNKARDGSTYEFDYNARGDKMVEAFVAKVEGIGDHPAILMWGLGNEVHLDEPYLRVVNRMSLEVHKRFPHHVTSLTMVNAKPENIAKVKQFAPDLDVLGIQSYSLGAVRGAIKATEQHWGKPFYMSEFNTKGPWNFSKTSWGVAGDESVAQKVKDLKGCYLAIDESKLCLGSTIFLWGHAVVNRPTYFSMLLDRNPAGPGGGAAGTTRPSFKDLYRTPQAEVMIEHFTGKPVAGNRAPVLTGLTFEGGETSRIVKPKEAMRLALASQDSDGDSVEYVTWILDSSSAKTKTVAGPFAGASGTPAVIEAPEARGEYLLMVYVIDNKGGASASTLAFKVE